MLKILHLILLIFCSVSLIGQNLSVYRSEKSVDETVGKIVEIINSDTSLIFFETVAHDSIAMERGLELSPTRSILFEEPRLTTELINCQQTAALDLPLEIIVWEEYGDVYIGFMDPKFMRRRFMIDGCDDTIQGLAGIMTKVAMDAIRQL
ncbi:MAG: DUF302 domain-containing protein [Cyclobacteriaceae bacterium]